MDDKQKLPSLPEDSDVRAAILVILKGAESSDNAELAELAAANRRLQATLEADRYSNRERASKSERLLAEANRRVEDLERQIQSAQDKNYRPENHVFFGQMGIGDGIVTLEFVLLFRFTDCAEKMRRNKLS